MPREVQLNASSVIAIPTPSLLHSQMPVYYFAFTIYDAYSVDVSTDLKDHFKAVSFFPYLVISILAYSRPIAQMKCCQARANH